MTLTAGTALPMTESHRLFRPPAEAESLILRVADGCPWNRCTFCGMYKGVPYRLHELAEIESVLKAAATADQPPTRVFLADGDAMVLPTSQLIRILDLIAHILPNVTRVNTYANGRSITAKTDSELRDLRLRKLHTLYLGLESGSDAVLRHVKKDDSVTDMISGAQRAAKTGLRMSVMFLLGLGGRPHRDEHVRGVADAVNRMQPRLLSSLRVIPVPGTGLYHEWQHGKFNLPSETDIVKELRDILARLELSGTVFRANHTSNVIPLEGRFPKDKAKLVRVLDAALRHDLLDDNGPGNLPAFL